MDYKYIYGFNRLKTKKNITTKQKRNEKLLSRQTHV